MVIGKVAVVAGAAAAATVLAVVGAVGVRLYRAKKRAKKTSTDVEVLTDAQRSDAEKFECNEPLQPDADEARLALVSPGETSGSPLTSAAGVGEQPSPAKTDAEGELAPESIDWQSLHCDFGEVPSATTRAKSGAERKQSQDGRDDVFIEASAAGITFAGSDCLGGRPESIAADVAKEESIAVRSASVGLELRSHEKAANVECYEKVVTEKPDPARESSMGAVSLIPTTADRIPPMSTMSGDDAQLTVCGLLELPALAKNHQLSPTAAPFYPSRHLTPCIKHSLSPFAAPFYPPSHVRAFDS